jgi:DNA-binding PadR family transcriptional regulator
MYWSGNNNQIYKALLQMQNEGLVTNEVIHQDSSPSKKVYKITEEGIEELKEWVLSNPETPEFKKTFLIQLAWSNLLNNQELNDLLLRYENGLKIQLLMQQEKSSRSLNSPNRNNQESFIWDMISQNFISSYKTELDWVQEVRQKLFENEVIEEKNKMSCQIINSNNKKYLEFFSTVTPLSTENDALELVALCGENDTNLLMIHYTALSEDFFKLKTKAAGNILQKFMNYHIRAVAVIPNEISQKGRFKELAVETNKGNHFRMYESREEAEKWLLQ